MRCSLPEPIEAIFPLTVVQTCIVQLIRHSLKYVPRRQYDQVVKDPRPIDTAMDADGAQAALAAFDHKWGKQLPVITQAWRDAWEHVIPFLAFPEEVRRVIYTPTRSRRSVPRLPRGLHSLERGWLAARRAAGPRHLIGNDHADVVAQVLAPGRLDAGEDDHAADGTAGAGSGPRGPPGR